MRKITIMLDDYLYEFYRRVGENAGDLEPEQVIVDALFKLAGELSLNSMKEKIEEKQYGAS
ncbi:MAG: hypothetical protein ACOYJD_04260 [Christensenellales bacterium]